MKLQKQSSRKKDDPNYEKYVKWVLVVPTDRIKQLGWIEGQEVKDEIKGNSLLISPVFKDKKKNILKRHPSGLTWTKKRDKLTLPQKYPNNQWVKRLEKEIGLARIKIGNISYWNFENDSIYTIGYEGYTIDKFIKKLKDSNIQQLIDVREIALSRKNGFSKSILASELRKNGIIYKHLPELGSPKDIRRQLHQDWDYKKFFKEYQKHIHDEDVMQNISIIEGLAKRRKTILMCFEKDFKKCHRSIIAEELKRRGWKVNNL